MTIYRFIIRSLWYFRKQHLAVFTGTLISTAVLTGALIIGDSVNFSLRKLVEARLGNTEYVLVSGSRFVRADLASEQSSIMQVSSAPLMLLQGIAINSDANLRINTAQVVGIDSSFWTFAGKAMPSLEQEQAMVSENVAQKLNLKKGDEFLLRVENATIIPVNAPFVPESKPSVAIRLTIKAIVNDSCFGRFSLRSNQAAPFNVFVSRRFILKKLNLSNLSNCILFSDHKKKNIPQVLLEQSLSKVWQTEDAGLEIHKLSDSINYEISSNRVFIDEPISQAILKIPLPQQKVLTYLVNSIRFNGKTTPYSFITAASFPIVPENIKMDEIIVNQWLSEDLGVKVGDSISLDYYVIGPLRRLSEKSRRFVVRQVIPTERGLNNRSLMPSFPGLSDAGSCRDWNTGIPIDLKKIRYKDEKYWNDFKGTPKAFISLETGVDLWSNQFGNLTAIRFSSKDITVDSLQKAIIRNIAPADIGINITPVHQNGLLAANNAVDFGELFLSLSFFIIAAGILLTVLLHTLNVETRNLESGVLAGLGLNNKSILRIRFAESSMVILFGGIFGALFGILYNYGLMKGLNSVWHDAVRVNTLEVNIKFSTLLIGSLGGIIIALLSVFFVTRRKLKHSIANLVKGISADSTSIISQKMMSGKIIAFIGIIGALILVSVSIATSSFENAGLFLSAGGLFLIGSSAFIIQNISYSGKISGQSVMSISHLAIKNAGRNRGRSITIILVLAIGIFSIILTGSYRKTFYGSENTRKSGVGGFLLWAETTLPIIYNLNTPEGKKNLMVNNEKDLKNVQFLQLQSLDGDDASCLNLNQVQHPRILGISPDEFDKRRAFSFSQLQNDVNKDHPWISLDCNMGKNVYPAFADQTVIKYGLKKSLGDTLFYKNETGDTIKLVIIGGLDNSIFQGNLLISDKVFGKQFPSSGGSKIILIDAPKEKEEPVAEIIRNSFADYGIEITQASSRLAEFNSVENTYLSVFMALGGLGIIIGTLGMGIILYRNMLERQHELGVLLALGFKKSEIFRLVVTENIFLLTAGIICGLVSSIIGILPSILSPAFSVNVMFLVAIIVSVFIIGGLWIVFLVRSSMKVSLISLLRND